MPIAVRVVSEQAYAAWVEEAKKKFATDDRAPPRPWRWRSTVTADRRNWRVCTADAR